MNYIPADQAHKMVVSGELRIVDIREPYELEICSIEAIHIPMAEISARVDEIPSTGNVAIMCRSGRRADAVANMLVTEFHRTNISVLEGGILAWIEKVETHLEAY